MERQDEGSNMEFNINIAYLFKGISKDLLEEETYIIQALNDLGGKPGYKLQYGNDDSYFVSRWPDNKFPLRIFVGPDYGFLFTPLELKQLQQTVQNILIRIHGIDPGCFQFIFVPERHKADIAIKWRRVETIIGGLNHCYPDIGREKQLKTVELIINVPVDFKNNSIAQSMIPLNVVHNLLHALGVFGHSNNPFDSAYKEWSPHQQILTPRDIKTLQLLYRCPLAMTKKDLLLLWSEYQSKSPILPTNSTLEAMIRNTETKGVVALSQYDCIKPSELSGREVALQEFFNRHIRGIKEHKGSAWQQG